MATYWGAFRLFACDAAAHTQRWKSLWWAGTDGWCFPTCSHSGDWGWFKKKKRKKKEYPISVNDLKLNLKKGITDECLHFSFVVKVHSVNNLLLSILHNFPNCPSNHVTSWERGDGKTMSFSCQGRNAQKTSASQIVEVTSHLRHYWTHLWGWQSGSISAAVSCQKHCQRRQVCKVWNLHCCFGTVGEKDNIRKKSCTCVLRAVTCGFFPHWKGN